LDSSAAKSLRRAYFVALLLNDLTESFARESTLRVSKQRRGSLKAAAAVLGRPLYDVTNEAIEPYWSRLKVPSEPARRAK
jgi:hypothetical protein